MREMKDSGVAWIGAIPTTWHTQKMKYISNFIQNKYSSDYGLLPYIGLENIASWSGSFISTNSQYDREQSLICEPEDILFGKLRPYLAKVYMNDRLCCCSNEFAVIRVNGQNKRYMWYQLLSHGFIFEIDRSTYGTKMPRANAEFIRNVFVALPSEIEQQKIANYLDKTCAEIDAVLEKTRASIEEYKKLKQAVITQAVTKGVRGDRPMKDSGIEWIGNIPAEWEIKRVKNICSLKTGSTPSTGNAEWFNGDLLWFTPGDFNEKFVLLSSNRTLSRTAEKDGVATMIPANSVLVVCIGGSAGKVGYTNYGCSCNQQITALCKSNIMPKLLMYDVNAGMPFLRNTTMFTTLPILNNQAIGGLVLPIPREEEQLSIIEYLDEKCAGIDALIAKKQQYLTEIENYKKSLIYEYVTGKKEVV